LKRSDYKLIKPSIVSSKEDVSMRESKKEQVYVRVKDLAGNEFVCPIDALRGLKEVPEEILDDCVDQ